MPTIEYTETLSTTICWCGIHFAVPSILLRNAHENAQEIHCPLGHVVVWRETEADRQRKRADEAEARAKRQELRANAERYLREDTERRLSAQRGATTRAKKRAAAAVCPVDGCGRSFVQLRRHLATKHPDYDPSAA